MYYFPSINFHHGKIPVVSTTTGSNLRKGQAHDLLHDRVCTCAELQKPGGLVRGVGTTNLVRVENTRQGTNISHAIK